MIPNPNNPKKRPRKMMYFFSFFHPVFSFQPQVYFLLITYNQSLIYSFIFLGVFYGFVELFLTTMNVCGTDEKHFSLVGSIVVTIVFFFPLDLFSCKNVEWVFLMLSAVFQKFLFHHLIFPPSLCFFAAPFSELERKNAFMRNILPFDVLVLCVLQLVCILKVPAVPS